MSAASRYDAWRLAAPDDGDELPPGYEFAEHEGGEFITCRNCGDSGVDISGESVVSREVTRPGAARTWHWFCSPRCACEDYADRMICAAEARAEARRDR